jgi:hypothetical protein
MQNRLCIKRHGKTASITLSAVVNFQDQAKKIIQHVIDVIRSTLANADFQAYWSPISWSTATSKAVVDRKSTAPKKSTRRAVSRERFAEFLC